MRRRNRLDIFPLGFCKLLRIVMWIGRVPVTLLEIVLKPRLVVKAFAVNRLDLRAQNAPLGPRMLAKLLVRDESVAIEAQVAGLYVIVLFGFGLADQVQIVALDAV